METFKCHRCNVEKSIDEFSKQVKGGKRLQSWCKACHREHYRDKIGGKQSMKQSTADLCEICGQNNLGRTKATHFQKYHPECGFRPAYNKAHKLRYECVVCGFCVSSFRQLIQHYKRGHTVRKTLPSPVNSIQQEFKRCVKCQLVLSVDKFDKDRASADGLQSWCKDCHHKTHFPKKDSDIDLQNPLESDPMQKLDNFFDHLGQMTAEIKSLRQEVSDLKNSNNQLTEELTAITQERDKWKLAGMKWSKMLVETQELLARPSR